MSTADAFAGLEPERVWAHFAELTRIPRPSKHEDDARVYVLEWARTQEQEARVDAAGNVVVRVPATTARKKSPTVVLQSHLDMVCEREPESPFDPSTGRIHVVREGDWVLAEGTTLGADNGIGVAAAMAVAEDADLEHGPLELLFTVSEEQGLAGAKELDPALVRGRLLLNLDGTSDEALTIGCAGSVHTFTRFPLDLQPLPNAWVGLTVALEGARGGHSGGDIARGRVNAIKALGGILGAASRAAPLRLASVQGGASRNAIPRTALASLATLDAEEGALREAVATEAAALRERYAGTDDAIQVVVERAEIDTAADSVGSTRALDLLAVTPTGVLAMSPAAPGSVETSTSLSLATTQGSVISLASMTRSSSTLALDEVVVSLEAIARLAGAEIDVVHSYRPWQPDASSTLRATATETFQRLFGHEPEQEVVHGGLECAVIAEKLPGVDMLAIGPTIEGPHAPRERLGITSTERFYRFLGALLADLSA